MSHKFESDIGLSQIIKDVKEKLISEFIKEWKKLDYWITDHQERSNDEYDRKIVDWKELHKYILFLEEKWEKRLNE